MGQHLFLRFLAAMQSPFPPHFVLKLPGMGPRILIQSVSDDSNQLCFRLHRVQTPRRCFESGLWCTVGSTVSNRTGGIRGLLGSHEPVNTVGDSPLRLDGNCCRSESVRDCVA
jgi:hypothetical protein